MADRGHDKEYQSAVQDGNGHAAETDGGGRVYGVVVRDTEVRIGRERSGEDHQSLMRRWCMRRRGAMNAGAVIGKRPGK